MKLTTLNVHMGKQRGPPLFWKQGVVPTEQGCTGSEEATLRYVLPADLVRPVPAEPLSTLQDFPCNRRPGLCDCACGQFTGSFAPRALAPAIGPSG